ncbi:30S ribosomal protein S7 [Candidatus Berkiella aquae]|uniref:Small ribosomal subunit protein uS7 n=1 Tax=Candidatus Berkiella aquae TaxID=295108 RepID=A0A0Q9YBI4_9GAMM|nr:30S ribosomal protein S7 [Candidatus Berkiella aquae]MCS5710261.1 30S ribosomal protein S7 [Candidatus Berkiella aquae]
MPRRRVVTKRKTLPDPVYGSELAAKFINHLMQDGKKSIAEKSLYGALEIIRDRGNKDPIELFKRAVENVRPTVEVKSRRVGGATYQIPVEVRPSRSTALAMRWIVDYSRKRGEKGMTARLAAEILDAADEEGGSRGKGGAVKKREDTHRMAEANKAFSHFRW